MGTHSAPASSRLGSQCCQHGHVCAVPKGLRPALGQSYAHSLSRLGPEWQLGLKWHRNRGTLGLPWSGDMGVANLGVHKQVAMGRLPITSCTADSLHVALEAWGQSQVQHSPNIWTVQAHPKRHCGHYHPQVALHEGLLYSSPLPAAHAGMVCFSYCLGSTTCREGERMIDETAAGTRRKGPWVPRPA